MSDAGVEGAFLGQGAAVADDGVGVHLEVVVVVESHGLVADDAAIERESAFLQAFTAARVAAIEDRHVVFFREGVDRREQAAEVFLRVDVFLAVRREQDVVTGLQVEFLEDVALLDGFEIFVQDLRHRGARDKGALFRQAALGEIAACMLAVGHVDIADDIHDAAVRLLRQALVLAAVARLHVENRDMQALGRDGRQARVRIAEDQQRIRLDGAHELVRSVDDVADRGAEVVADRVHVDLWLTELQVMEKHAVQVIVVVLPRMREDDVEIPAAGRNRGGEPDDFRARAHDDEELQPPIVLEMDIAVVEFYAFLVAHFCSTASL